MNEETTPWYISSSGDGLAMRIKGTLLAVLPLILIALKFFNFEIGEGELRNIIDQIEAVTVAVTGAISAIMVIYGTGRALYYRFKK